MELTTFHDSKDSFSGPEMVVIPPGRFRMGSPSNEAGRTDDEGPLHEVHIGYAFAVGKYPITRGEWRQYVVDTGHSGSDEPGESWLDPSYPQDDSHPVVYVSWNEAQDYASWLSQKTGHRYRLLSEAEYEYINRAGSRSAYFWGSAWEGYSHHLKRDGSRGSWPVGKLKPNAFGVYDTSGHVWCWTQDCWHDDYSGAPTDGSAWTTGGDCRRRVLRGGAWFNDSATLRVAHRSWHYAASNGPGFRLARTAP
jgi:formylglycine-generating enzyme required for sulfatase activity